MTLPKKNVPAAAQSDLVEITGFLRVIDDATNIGTRYIALSVDGEKGQKNAKGYPPLRGVTLMKPGNDIFTKLAGITLASGDVIGVEVLSSDIERDMQNGKGLSRSNSFRGFNVRVIASQLDATVLKH